MEELTFKEGFRFRQKSWPEFSARAIIKNHCAAIKDSPAEQPPVGGRRQCEMVRGTNFKSLTQRTEEVEPKVSLLNSANEMKTRADGAKFVHVPLVRATTVARDDFEQGQGAIYRIQRTAQIRGAGESARTLTK